MALRFNVPPNWPTPPEGWAPEPGWQPDPAWGPAPEGWKFWVEDGETGQDAAAAASSVAAPEAGAAADNQDAPYQQQPYAAAGAASSYTAAGGNQPPQKKNFFTTTAGILTIIGAILLALILALVLILAAAFKSDDSSEASDTSSSSSRGGAAIALSEGSGNYKEYSGSGDDVIEIEQPAGSQESWVEYGFEGTRDTYNSFSISGLDSAGENTGDSASVSLDEGSEDQGSFWLNVSGSDRKTEEFEITASGDWTIRVHPAADAPVYTSDDTITGNTGEAFVVKGSTTKAHVKYNAPDDIGNYSLRTYDSELEMMTIDMMGESPYDGTGSVRVSDSGTPMYFDTMFAGEWEVTFE